jgi:cytochrome c oxidase assembly factor CtaG
MTANAAWHTWTFQPVVLAGVAASAAAYAWGVRSLWRRGGVGRGVAAWRTVSFGLGLVAILAALVSPLDAAADELLSAHMAQHLLLMVVAAPLLVLGAPGLAMSAGLTTSRRRAMHAAGRHALIRRGRRLATHPVASWLIATSVLWAWHLPGVYDAAVRNGSLHSLEHLSFLGSAFLFWWVALQPSGPRRMSRGAGIVYVFAGALQSGALGALLAFAPTPIYPLYAQRAAAWGTSPLADQQLAGLLMWVPSFLVYLVAAGALFLGWLRAEERDARRAEARARSPMTPLPTEVGHGV